MSVVELLQMPVLIPALLLLGYLALLSILALVGRHLPPPAAKEIRRLAIVVPAHNEELTIERTVGSLKKLEYPAGKFSVTVIADNCTDTTAALARQAGVDVLERRNETERGKGYALRWAIDRLLKTVPEQEAFIVIDADTEAAPDFLRVVNEYLDAGAQVVQSSDMVRPQPEAWSAEMTRIGFTLYNHARPLGRSMLGGSAGLRGNGMCFRASVMRAHPWDAFSRAEDLEFGLMLLLEGISVTFAPEARVIATMPLQAHNAVSQRTRWEGGRLPLIRRYAGRLLKNSILHGSYSCFDALMDLVTPPVVTTLVAALGFAVVNIGLAAAGVPGTARCAVLWSCVVVLGLTHLFVGLKASGADRGQYEALRHLPRYATWKLGVYARRILGAREHEWVRTTRES